MLSTDRGEMQHIIRDIARKFKLGNRVDPDGVGEKVASSHIQCALRFYYNSQTGEIKDWGFKPRDESADAQGEVSVDDRRVNGLETKSEDFRQKIYRIEYDKKTSDYARGNLEESVRLYNALMRHI